MPDYDGFANWGTWNLTNCIWGDTEEELAGLLAVLPAPQPGVSNWTEGAEVTREFVEGLASSELSVVGIFGNDIPPDPIAITPVITTLMREGTDNIDWDALALFWRWEA